MAGQDPWVSRMRSLESEGREIRKVEATLVLISMCLPATLIWHHYARAIYTLYYELIIYMNFHSINS